MVQWTRRRYEGIILDPFTAPGPGDATRNRRDPLRISSLENGILLCLLHHKGYDTFRFSINPTVLPWFSGVCDLHLTLL